MIIDGRAMAREVLSRTKVRAENLGYAPRVAAIVTSETAVTKSYLSIKAKRAEDAGCVLEVVRLSPDTSTAALIAAVCSSDADAIIAQLPLLASVNAKEVCDAIPVEKDTDVLSTAAREEFNRGDKDALLPPVTAAMREILVQHNVQVKGKKAVVIGEGWLVGKPCATWLKQQGADVEVVTVITHNLRNALGTADIVVSGAGSPHLIKPGMLKEGAVLIDAGTTESGGEIVGDADPACAEVCSLFTPVPGGVGPISIACLFENAVTLLERATNT